MNRQLLLNPGPVTLSSRVRKALLNPDLCHREPEFSVLQDNIRNKLLDIYNLPRDEWATVLLTGSGTSAVEAMITSLVPDNGRLLVIENGIYGERMTNIAAIHRISHQHLHQDWGSEIDLEALERELTKKSITHLAVVHHETTTGRLNQISGIGELCGKHGVELLLDGVSSFGAEDLSFLEWNITACAATANKCLHGVPGTSFVIVRRKALNDQTVTARSLYLDLNRYLHQQDKGGTPFTQSVQCFYALDEALDELNDNGGRKQRQQDYLSRMQIVRNGFVALGIQPLLASSDCSCVLHAYNLPAGCSYQQLHDALKAKGYVIYAGQGDLSRTIFRISAMGDINEDDMTRLVKKMGEIVG